MRWTPSAPPRGAEALLRRGLAASGMADLVIGDLREEFAQRTRGRGALAGGGLRAPLRTRLWYWSQALRLLVSRDARPLRRPPLPDPGNPRPGIVAMLASIAQDIRYGLRSLRKTPVFTVAAVLTLALGIGANAAIFSMVNAVLLEPLPYPDPGELVRIYAAYPDRDIWRGTASDPDLRDWREQNSAFRYITAFPALNVGGFVLTGNDRPDLLQAHYVHEDFFPTLGVEPLLGRALSRDDHQDGRNRVVVLSHDTWQRRFAGDPAIVGSTITLSDNPFQVIGVMPPGFDYPSPEGELWVPLSVIPEDGIPRLRFVRFLSAVGRLAPGVTLEAAEADLSTVAQRIAAEYPDSNEQLTAVRLEPLRENVIGDSRTALLTLFGAVGVVLLICCANVANLMLVRSQRRSREFAVRSAVGGSGARLARQLVTESTLLALLGGAAGVAIGGLALGALMAAAPTEVPRLAEIRIDASVMLFALAASLVTGLLFGLAPAWRAWRGDLQTELRLSAATGAETEARSRVRGLLVVAEVALVVVLVIGAGLLLRSLTHLLDVEPGFDVDLTMSMDVAAPGYRLETSADIATFYADLLREVRDTPGVESAGVLRPMPLTRDTFQGEDFRFTVVGQPAPPEGQEPSAAIRFASDDVFETLGIPLLAGRDFDATDTVEAGELRGIINQSFAERHFPDGDAVGQRLAAGSGQIHIIGVVGDIKQMGLDEEPANVVYTPITQMTRSGMTLVVRTRAAPTSVQDAVNQAIWKVNPDQTIENVTTLDALVRESVAEQAFSARLVALFAGLALLLAAVGIYGVVANAVAQRNREIGIRMALGAKGPDVVRFVVSQGMAWVLVGIVVGLAAALALGRFIGSLLYGVTTTDPVSYAGAAFVLAAVALFASLVPAWRAITIDPVRSLRSD